ncbi:MAG: Flp pilus assembly protein CpaB [Pseudomonadota bacterium]
MNKRLLILGALAVAFAGTTITAADWWLRNNIETVVVEKTVEVKPQVEFATIAVASQPLRYGEELTRSVVKEIPWPQSALPEGAFASTDDLLEDGRRIVLRAMAANEPILKTKVTGSNDKGSLSRLLDPGTRAVTINVNATTGVAGFVLPGDRVDIVLHRYTDVDPRSEETNWLSPIDTQVRAEGTQVSVATTILADVKILTIDQMVDETLSEPHMVTTVTLALTPVQAKTVTAAASAGTLHLHLRGAGDTDVASQPEPSIDPTPTAAFAPTGAQTIQSNKVDIVVRQGQDTRTVTVPAEGGAR